MKRKTIIWRIILTVLFILTAGFSFWGGKALAEKQSGKAAVPLTLGQEITSLEQASVRVAEVVNPAVVNIRTTQKVARSQNQFGDLFNDPFFRRFFGDMQPQEPREYLRQALGSGVIVSPDGYILTNNHVIKDAAEVRVKLLDGREFNARIVGKDEKTDLALAKINAENLPYAVFGDSSMIKVGQWVMAIGNPFGLEGTVTVGVVSATGRHLGINPIESFIQTDASINQGNSGGPLVNLKGEVIGINTAIVASGQGIGFAIPSNMAQSVFEQIRTSGKVVRGYLGISMQPIDLEMAQEMGLKQTNGVLVANVYPGTPAEKANLKPGDVIVNVNNIPVKGPDDIQSRIGRAKPGDTVVLQVIRNGKMLAPISVRLVEQPAQMGAAALRPGAAQPGEEKIWRGMKLVDITPDIANKLGLAVAYGVVVVDVSASSPAAGKLSPQSVILEVNRQAINNLSDFFRVVKEISDSKSAMVRVYAGGNYKYLIIPGKPPKSPLSGGLPKS
ncbi:MAG: Do family serine endopeptidase [Candidatus Omnitrophota bacterium]|nr:Do family serine endopeptidase [Candidatus Omnitrophota bacterium]